MVFFHRIRIHKQIIPTVKWKFVFFYRKSYAHRADIGIFPWKLKRTSVFPVGYEVSHGMLVVYDETLSFIDIEIANMYVLVS